MIKNALSLTLVVSALWMGTVLPARSQDLMVQAIAEASEKNAQALKTYTWKMRLQPSVEGQPKPARLYQVRYDTEGKLQRTLLTALPEQPKRHGIRRLVQNKKATAAKEFTTDVFETVKTYMAMDSAHLRSFFSQAQKNQDGLLVKLTRQDYLQPGDEVSIWVDVLSRSPKKYTFSTQMEGSALRGTADFAKLPDGTSYASTVRISSVEHQADFLIENFEFAKQ